MPHVGTSDAATISGRSAHPGFRGLTRCVARAVIEGTPCESFAVSLCAGLRAPVLCGIRSVGRSSLRRAHLTASPQSGPVELHPFEFRCLSGREKDAARAVRRPSRTQSDSAVELPANGLVRQVREPPCGSSMQASRILSAGSIGNSPYHRQPSRSVLPLRIPRGTRNATIPAAEQS